MKTMIIEKLRSMLPECDIQFYETTKTNGVVKTGITICEKGSSVAPVIYLEDNYPDLDTAVTKIIDIYRHTKADEISNIAADFTNYESMKDHITYILLNKALNPNLLETVLNKDFLDLILVPVVRIRQEEDNMLLKITKHLVSIWGVSENDIFEQAEKNLNNEVYKIMDMSDMIHGMPADVVYILSNTAYMYGATMIARDDVLTAISNKVGGDFILIPSSLHECIIFRESFSAMTNDLNDFIKFVNYTNLETEDILSDHAYIYRNGKMEVL